MVSSTSFLIMQVSPAKSKKRIEAQLQSSDCIQTTPVLLRTGRYCSEIALIKSIPLTKIKEEKSSPVPITNSTEIKTIREVFWFFFFSFAALTQ